MRPRGISNTVSKITPLSLGQQHANIEIQDDYMVCFFRAFR